jgi:dUTPase
MARVIEHYQETIEIELVEGGTMPFKAHESDSCYDCIARTIEHGPNYIAYKLGFKTKIPEGWEGELRSRSSISKYNLSQCNSVGTIDQDYRGEWEIRFNVAPPNFMYYEMNGELPPLASQLNIYKVGDKVAQILFRKKDNYTLAEVAHVSSDETDRGDGGFGSSGE